ncbi:MAG: DNA polymerase III subunit delta' [Hyphomicrobiales bacterium]|nr:DNA polymerase III subunit delta' [Hyphomicrobiales bacterium]
MNTPQTLPPEADDAGPPPRLAETLHGHAGVEASLLQAWRAGRLPHALLLSGQHGIGKATLAWRLAKFLLAHGDATGAKADRAVDLALPPGHPVALRVAHGGHGDISHLRREWNDKTKRHFTEIRVDDVRRVIDQFHLAPAEAGWRIAIVDAADDLNRSAANALLKLVEEPPARALFLIIAHRPGQVLATLRSRCQRIEMAPLAQADLVAVLRDLQPGRAEADLAAAAASALGSVREALERLDDANRDLDALLARVLARLPQPDWRDIHTIMDMVVRAGQDRAFARLVTGLETHLEEQIHAGVKNQRPLAGLNALAQARAAMAEAVARAEALNLDRRALVMGLFRDLVVATTP